MNRRVRIMLRWTIVWLPVFLIAWMLDGLAYDVFLDRSKAAEDWVQMLRQIGYLPTWILVGVLFLLVDRRRGGGRPGGLVAPVPAKPRHHRAGLVVLSAIGGGLVANVLKPIIGRLRPDSVEGVARFAERPAVLWADGGDLGLGLPSGHTTVAFAGCGMVALLVPAWRWPMMILAAGCGLTRLFAGAHALSDVVAGAWVGLAVACWLWAWGEGPRRGPANGLLPRDP